MSPSPGRTADRRRFLRLAGATSAAAALAGQLAACDDPDGADGPDRAARGSGDRIDAGISGVLSTGFDPVRASGVTPVAANTHLFEALVDLEPAGRRPYAALADRLPTRVDATTYRVDLRPSATFHDNTPVTTGDVEYSFARILDPSANSLMTQFLPFLDTVRALNGSTVEFRLKYPFEFFASRLSVVKIVPRHAVEADPKTFDARPVGSGPYRLAADPSPERVAFRRWEAYNGPKPAKVPDMVWQLLPDGAARDRALLSGTVAAVDDVPYAEVETMARQVQVEPVESFGNLFLMFNLARRPFHDKRVRQALHYALDVDRIVAEAMHGNGSPVVGYLPQSHPAHIRASTVYRHDPARARALLASAGATGLDLTLSATDHEWVAAITPLVKEAWDAVGVTTTLDTAPSADQYRKVDAGEFQVLAAPGDPSVFGNDADLLLRWFYAGTWPAKRFRWAGSAQDRQLRTLLDQAVQTTDSTRRRSLWSTAFDLIADEVPLYPVVHRKLPTAWRLQRLLGFQALPTTGLSFLDVDALPGR
ncbi:ABC transporter substrate-binding protein [Kitasatospora sp. NPDC048365]|uniref:ABC transporter substrate-binding protein n=1 Tax=Kitasatospora sp. NPDC048365 TaxID=3364050 RepID=UPI0037131591